MTTPGGTYTYQAHLYEVPSTALACRKVTLPAAPTTSTIQPVAPAMNIVAHSAVVAIRRRHR